MCGQRHHQHHLRPAALCDACACTRCLLVCACACAVSAPAAIGRVAKEVGAWVLYISTDYVFDGTSPPYTPESKPNPLNKVGDRPRLQRHAESRSL